MPSQCNHLDQIKINRTDKRECEDCVKTGDTWVELRLCLSCGHVGCCDSSKNKHARGHFNQTRHPLISPALPVKSWTWCYVDNDYVEQAA